MHLGQIKLNYYYLDLQIWVNSILCDLFLNKISHIPSDCKKLSIFMLILKKWNSKNKLKILN